jgi:hypothetical protein
MNAKHFYHESVLMILGYCGSRYLFDMKYFIVFLVIEVRVVFWDLRLWGIGYGICWVGSCSLFGVVNRLFCFFCLFIWDWLFIVIGGGVSGLGQIAISWERVLICYVHCSYSYIFIPIVQVTYFVNWFYLLVFPFIFISTVIYYCYYFLFVRIL